MIENLFFAFVLRFIIDFLNFLNDQKELLDIRKLKLAQIITECCEPIKKRFKSEPVDFTLNELISDEFFEQLVDSVKCQPESGQKILQTKNLIENINKYMSKITRKISIGRELLEVVEKF